MTDTPVLETQAARFAGDLTATVQAVSPGCSPFAATAVADANRFVVSQTPAQGVPLRVGGEPLLTLLVRFQCVLDGVGRFLAVEKSGIAVHAGQRASGEPLFSFEYDRRTHSVPVAHIQVHAHRDALSHVLARAGSGTQRARRRADSTGIPALSQLHFPVGGHRFRPCLEDVLEMLIDEFGIDDAGDAKAALREGRERWRHTQTRSAVRDDPAEAAIALRELGYAVQWSGGGDEPEPQRERLQAP